MKYGTNVPGRDGFPLSLPPDGDAGGMAAGTPHGGPNDYEAGTGVWERRFAAGARGSGTRIGERAAWGMENGDGPAHGSSGGLRAEAGRRTRFARGKGCSGQRPGKLRVGNRGRQAQGDRQGSAGTGGAVAGGGQSGRVLGRVAVRCADRDSVVATQGEHPVPAGGPHSRGRGPEGGQEHKECARAIPHRGSLPGEGHGGCSTPYPGATGPPGSLHSPAAIRAKD